MSDRHTVIEQIRTAFAGNEFPGEAFLQGSFEGCEPSAEVGPFRSQQDWQAVQPDFLDGHYNALCFFSEAGFRFFLPAYLIADLNEQLMVAEPLFHLAHGFSDISIDTPAGGRTFVIHSGKSCLINPRRYGAATFEDYARFRLSIFTREEASAIVAYLQFKRDHDPHGIEKPSIDAALRSFWLDRARTAPTAESLRRYLAEQEEYVRAISPGTEDCGRKC